MFLHWGGRLCAVVMLLLALVPVLAEADDAVTAATFHDRVGSLYAFAPHDLSTAQQEAKSTELDRFWADVKGDPASYLPLLRQELGDAHNSSFFAYDGSKLLLALSTAPADQSLALTNIARADLRDIQDTDYLQTVHWFAAHGFDATAAAFKILDYPEFQAFIPAHSLTLNQDAAILCLLGPMDEARYLDALIARLQREKDPVAAKSILQAIWYATSDKGNAAIAAFRDDQAQPQALRDYAVELQQRKPPAMAEPVTATVEQLRRQRRQAMARISDEALEEYDRLTAEILVKQQP